MRQTASSSGGPSPTAPDPVPPIRLIHASLPVGVLLLLAVTLALRPAPAVAPDSAVPFVLLAAGAAALIMALVLRGRLGARNTAEPAAAWWQANLTPAIIVWSLIEGGAMLGVVGYWVTGRPALLALPAAGLVLFLLTAPSRLEG